MEQQETQAGEAKEQPKEAISEAVSEATSVEEKATSTRTEEEFRKIQSMKDKAEAAAQLKDRELQSVQARLNELETSLERQRLENRRREIESLADDPDAQKRVITLHELEDQRNKLERDLKSQQDALVRKYNQATELAAQFDVSITELLKAETPREMELLAQVMSKKPKEEAPKEGFKPDSGMSDVGGENDESFMKRYSEGKSDDHERARKILAKL